MLPPPYPPACRLLPGDAIVLGAWVTLSALLGFLLADGAVLALRAARKAFSAYRARRLYALHESRRGPC